MADTRYLDVVLEVPYEDVQRLPRLESERMILERLRGKADQVADDHRVKIRTDRGVEIHVSRGSHVLHGGDWLLCAARFPLDR